MCILAFYHLIDYENVIGLSQNGDKFLRLSITGNSSNFRHAEVFLTTHQDANTISAGALGGEHSLQGLFAKPTENNGSYVSFSAVLRTNVLQQQSNPVGIVSSFFGFPRGTVSQAEAATNEIDFEILRYNQLENNAGLGRNLLISSHNPTGLQAESILNTTTSSSFDYTQWNKYEFRQYSNHIEFYLNDVLLAQHVDFRATAGLKLAPSFNIWAPGSAFENAYMAGNGTPLIDTHLDVQSFTYLIFVVPEPSHTLLGVALIGIAARCSRRCLGRLRSTKKSVSV
jgi:hypothetical protein